MWRSMYVDDHGLALRAIAIGGATLVSGDLRKWKKTITGLRDIDWSRSNVKLWEGRALVSGRISKAQMHVVLTSNVIKKQLRMSLTAKEKEAESRLRDSRRNAA